MARDEVGQLSKLVRALPEATYVELVRSLCRTVLPTSIMAVSFTATGLLVSSLTQDGMLIVLTGLGTLAAVGRLAVLLAWRGKFANNAPSVTEARRLERWFAATYLVFAAVFSLFSARSFAVAPPEVDVLIIGLLFGYAAGVAAGVSLRPWIGISAIAVAVLPTMVLALSAPSSAHRALGCLLAIFTFGGIQSVLSRYRYATSSITTGIVCGALARTDPLTGLRNRLGLAESFNDITTTSASAGTLAVHCLDLDYFKPVNDRYGHPVGDLLLKAVAGRLLNRLRKGEIVARTGGDEFVVVQPHLDNESEAELMGRRLVRALSEPYLIGEQTLTIGVSIGYAVSSAASCNLEDMIKAADDALLRAKVERGAARRAEPWGKLTSISRV